MVAALLQLVVYICCCLAAASGVTFDWQLLLLLLPDGWRGLAGTCLCSRVLCSWQPRKQPAKPRRDLPLFQRDERHYNRLRKGPPSLNEPKCYELSKPASIIMHTIIPHKTMSVAKARQCTNDTSNISTGDVLVIETRVKESANILLVFPSEMTVRQCKKRYPINHVRDHDSTQNWADHVKLKVVISQQECQACKSKGRPMAASSNRKMILRQKDEEASLSQIEKVADSVWHTTPTERLQCEEEKGRARQSDSELHHS